MMAKKLVKIIKMKNLIIAIDGPSASGKGALEKKLARWRQ